MKLGERNQQKAALMLPWAVLMVPTKWQKDRIYRKYFDISFNIDIQTNLEQVDFRDVYRNLQNVTYRA